MWCHYTTVAEATFPLEKVADYFLTMLCLEENTAGCWRAGPKGLFGTSVELQVVLQLQVFLLDTSPGAKPTSLEVYLFPSIHTEVLKISISTIFRVFGPL